MKIIVVGAGNVGRELVARLSAEGHDIIVIDSSEKKLNEFIDRYDVMGVVGNGADFDVLEEAGIGTTDLFVACTAHDELNILCSLVAKKLGAKDTVSRVRSPEYFELFKERDLGLTMMVNPEYETAMEIAAALKYLSAIKIETFADGSVSLAEVKVTANSGLDGLELKDIRNRFSVRVLVCAVEREDGKVYIPRGDFTLKERDTIHVAAASKDIGTFFKEISGDKLMKRVMIAGGGKVAYYLAKKLRSQGIKVKIIESDEERCRILGEMLEKVEIVHGDASDLGLLLDEGLRRTDAFVSLCTLDEQNIIMSLSVRNQGAKKVIARVEKSGYYKMLQEAGVESVVSSKAITADLIARFARSRSGLKSGGAVKKLIRIMNDQAETLEFTVEASFKALDVPLKDVRFSDNALLATIIRNGEVFIPDGESVIKEGDTVIVVTTNEYTDELNDLVE